MSFHKIIFLLLFLLPSFSCKKKDGEEKTPEPTNQSERASLYLDNFKAAAEKRKARRERIKALQESTGFGLAESGMELSDVTGNTFCWKDTIMRPAGTIPEKCQDGYIRMGLLCYSECTDNETRYGFDCHANCPGEFDEIGLVCRYKDAEYGRGAGYASYLTGEWRYQWIWPGWYAPYYVAWWVSEIKHCESKKGSGNCEKSGALAYPKCKSGYSPFGCCLCKKNESCSSWEGLQGSFPDCAKKIRIGEAYTGECEEDEEEAVGLCYEPCLEGFKGLAMTCWAEEPPFDGWVDCGAGFADSDVTCGVVTASQIWSVAEMAISLATLGIGAYPAKGAGKAIKGTMSAAITAAEKAAETVSEVADAVSTLGSAATELQSEIASGGDGVTAYADVTLSAAGFGSATEMISGITTDSINGEITSGTVGAIVGTTMEIVEAVDPTGISSVISAYMYPVCTDLDGAYGQEAEDYFTICKNDNQCMKILEGSYEGNRAAISGTRAENRELYNGAFRINKTSDTSDLYTICVAGESNVIDTDLCLHVSGGTGSGKPVTLHNGVEYNSKKANGTFRIEPISEGSEYYTICIGGKSGLGANDVDLCLHAEGGYKFKLLYTKASNRTRGNGRFKIQHLDPLYYDDVIQLANNSTDTELFLDTRGGGCNGNKLCVSASSDNNRDNRSGSWKITSASDKSSEDCVAYGDLIHLENQYNDDGGYLDLHGSNCYFRHCITTANSNTRHATSGTWEILTTEDENKAGCVAPHDTIILENKATWKGEVPAYLSAYGTSDCKSNPRCVNASTTNTSRNEKWYIRRSYFTQQ